MPGRESRKSDAIAQREAISRPADGAFPVDGGTSLITGYSPYRPSDRSGPQTASRPRPIRNPSTNGSRAGIPESDRESPAPRPWSLRWFVSRQGALLWVPLAMAFAIALRLVHWQVVESGQLTVQLNAQHSLDTAVPAKRGTIRDTAGELLAGNLAVDFIFAVPDQIRRPEEVAAKLAPVLGTDASELLPLLSDKTKPYVRLLGGTRVDEAISDQIITLGLPGIFLEPTTRRTYPERSLGAHILGFVDGDGIGNYGLEGHWNKELAGLPGHLRAERDTAGNEIGFSDREWRPPLDGMDLILTIDRTIQYIAERELERAVIEHKADGGTVIVMNPKTGEILAMANQPTFDPNRYAEAARNPEILTNPAITFSYEPGSTFKVITMAGALNERLVTPDTTMDDSGALSIGGYTIHNWDGKANGRITMTQLLEKSSNIGASWTAFRLGKTLFYRYVTAFGFGAPTKVDLQGEGIGIVKNPKSPDWAEVDLATNSFGQAIAVTPMQMVTAVSAVANGGLLMRPYIVKAVVNPVTAETVEQVRPQIVRQAITRETAASLLQMLFRSAENGETRGTLVPGFKVAGKTGTASIPVDGGYDTKQTIASFIGAVPASDPQFVILVKIDRPRDERWGSLIAKPAFAIIGQELTRYLKVLRTEPIPPGVATAEARSIANALTTPTATARAGEATGHEPNPVVPAIVRNAAPQSGSNQQSVSTQPTRTLLAIPRAPLSDPVAPGAVGRGITPAADRQPSPQARPSATATNGQLIETATAQAIRSPVRAR